MKTLKEYLGELSKAIPIRWDRYVLQEDEGEQIYNIYGWIRRSDGQRDFVLLTVKFNETSSNSIDFITSSAKYSKELMKIIYGSVDEHADCMRVETLP